MGYSNAGLSEPSKFELIEDKLFLDGEELPNVIEFSLSMEEVGGEVTTNTLVAYSSLDLPLLKVRGCLDDDDGKPMVRYGELIEYNIERRVLLTEGEDSND